MTGQTPPDKLIKYYKCDEFSCDALLNNYLWASYPLQFNDPFDCSEKFWDLESFSTEAMISVLDPEIYFYFRKTSSNEERRKIFIELMSPGIICLNEPNIIESDILWGYYTNQEGFSIEFCTQELINSWNKLPSHVFYESNPETIDKFKLMDFHFAFEKWATTKKRIWDKEEEWRFIFTDTNSYHPILKKGDKTVRQKNYPKTAINSVVLGYKFFTEQIIGQRKDSLTEDTDVYTFSPKDNLYKIQVLLYAYEKGISLYLIYLTEDFRIIKREIEILDLKSNKVTIFYTGKVIE